MGTGDFAVPALGAALAMTTVSCHQSTLGPRWTGQMLQASGPYDQPPVPVTKAQPQYPEFAREAQITGTVVVHAWVGEDGRVRTCLVFRGITGLNDAAVQAARQWIFRPALRKYLPVAAWYDIPIRFSL